MRRVALLSDDAVFVRMLELELSFRGYSLSGKKEADLVIVDADTSEFYKENCIFFGRGEPKGERFLRRPFVMDEFFSLVENFFAASKNDEPIILSQNRISVAGESVSLSDSESALLSLLMANKGTPLSRERIAAEIFPDAEKDSNVADVYIYYLRQKIDEKLGKKYILTVRGKGYMISGE